MRPNLRRSCVSFTYHPGIPSFLVSRAKPKTAWLTALIGPSWLSNLFYLCSQLKHSRAPSELVRSSQALYSQGSIVYITTTSYQWCVLPRVIRVCATHTVKTRRTIVMYVKTVDLISPPLASVQCLNLCLITSHTSANSVGASYSPASTISFISPLSCVLIKRPVKRAPTPLRAIPAKGGRKCGDLLQRGAALKRRPLSLRKQGRKAPLLR